MSTLVASVQPAITNLPQECVRAAGLRFVEDGAGTYTGTITIPAYAVILDIIVHAEALWTAATSASLEIGDADDPDGFFTTVDLKATDLLAQESVSLVETDGGVGGAYVTATHITDRLQAAARTLTATVVSVGAGTAGRTDVVVIFAVPVLEEVTQ